MISREDLRAQLYNLIAGYDGPDGWVDGVVDFWSDDVDYDRMADTILAWFTTPALDEPEVAIEARRRYPAPTCARRGGRSLAHAEWGAFIAGARFADARLRGETHD